MNLFEHIKSVLSENETFCKDGVLFKNSVVEAGLKLDPKLLKLLLKDDKARKHFFTEIDDITVFDKTKFQKFVSNKQFLPDSFTAFKNRIGLTANGEYLTEANEVVLDFPYKDCVLEGGQTKEDQKRQEIFWNETLAPDEIDRLFEPKALCNWKKYTAKGIETKFKAGNNENYIIKGNNLLALHTIKKTFKSRIKLIYIDPPYNTGNDGFNYNDSFNHSAWLTFMKNRVEVARELLCSNGVIFISCDDNEFAYLKVLMDEVFGKENFIEMFSWKKSDTPSNLPKKSKKVLEYILCYEKNKDNVKYKGFTSESKSSNGLLNKVNKVGILTFPPSIVDTGLANGKYTKGKYGTDKYSVELLEDTEVKDGFFIKPIILKSNFKWGQTKLDEEIDRGTKISIRTKSLSPSYMKIEYEPEVPINYIDSSMGVHTTENAGKQLTKLFGKSVFTYPKSESLIEYLINMVSNKLTKDDYILDFHLGSGTTCAVAHKMGFNYIGIEQMDYIETVSVERLKKVIDGEQTGISEKLEWKGGGSFIYAELAEYTQKVIDKIINASDSNAILKIINCISDNYYIKHNIESNLLSNSIEEISSYSIDELKSTAISLIDKNYMYVNYADQEDSTFDISETDKLLNNTFFSTI
ncbi:DNA methyltransferase [Nonlabens agnitus]|uniref:site-specific DNA-methyltransferase (adenine-specific) n=1 Tax=Nonlabens agnitus TaxID=870484 RepID=A0A2S9WS59_9FLAO|nr:site-specific DNA-methyltransferase [Nonlabens agnitus]PRP66289.1 hypothetical protein BST86_03870 [Nonlabens agnitus]